MINKLIPWISRYHRLTLALVFLAGGLWARYLRFQTRELWNDELFQIKNTLGAFKPVWQRLPNGELTCFPGDYLITYPFVQIFHPEKWGMTIPHILASVLGFYFLYRICQKHLKTFLAFFITFTIYSFNHNLVYHAFEIRPYAVLPTLALGVFYFSDLIINHSMSLSRWKKIGIGLFFTFTVLYHAYGMLILFCCMTFFLLARTDKTPLPQVLKELAPFLRNLTLVTVPLFLWYAGGNPDFNSRTSLDRGINTFDYIPNPLMNFNEFFETVTNNLIAFKKFKFKFFLNGIWLAFLLPHSLRLKQIGFFLLLIVLPIELALLGDLHKGYWFVQRQFVWVMPLYAFFLGWCWDAILMYVTNSKLYLSFQKSLLKPNVE
ncbi:MAG TPA: hypothetical protein DD723_09375 [Candidatus Omnitrophica bacterium]|nr:MAG: hypothetical protein A2Y04_05130 [Omnitrophica WOR_2 bacterium GWC2_45_7]HBR15727.1 hypothetical protein [Candidatus Omnitrophota bacterium]